MATVLNIDHLTTAKEVFKIEAEAILGLGQQLNWTFNEVVERILKISGRVVVSGIGKSGHIGVKIAATLSSTGTPSIFLHPAEAVHGDLGMLKSEDIFLAISNSGETEEILKLIPFIKERRIPIIAFCSHPNSTLGKHANYFINIKVEQEACPLELAPTASTTATLAMGDALAVALMKAKDFQSEHFASFHPAGSLGRKLLTKVRDVMRTKALPYLPITASVQELVIKLSEGKLGLVIIGTAKEVQGVITDGDLRRALESTDFSQIQLSNILTRAPIIVSQEMKLVDAEKVMVKKKIATLLVKNEDVQISGVLQLYDLK